MSGRGHGSDHKESAALHVVRNYIPNLRPLDDLIRWWKNYKETCSKPVLVAKCDMLIVPLEECRRDLGDKVRAHAQNGGSAVELKHKYGWESSEFESAEALSNKTQRELSRTLDDMGRYIQPLVTKWFIEDDCFEVVNLEMQGPNYDFDILIADEHGNEYDIEVWFGQNKRHHALRELTVLCGGPKYAPHIDHGSVPYRLKDVASDLGGLSMNSAPDLRKVWDKLGQLRDGHTGFLIACRKQAQPLEMTATDFPIVPPGDIQTDKCIIVLDFDGTMDGEHGAGYLVHHPDFDQASKEVARKIIRALGFKYDQSRYTQKIELAKWAGWN